MNGMLFCGTQFDLWIRGRRFLARQALWSSIGLLSTVLVAFGCDEALPRERITWHPIPDSVSVDMENASVIPRDRNGRPDDGLSTFADRLRRRIKIASIGRIEGTPEHLFGEVVDGIFLEDGSLAVIDGQAKVISVFSSDGDHLYTVGGRGEGPGEMDLPVSLISPTPRDAWVVEAARGIHRFSEVAGTLQFMDRLSIDSYSVRDACSSAGTTIIHIPSHVNQQGQAESTIGEVLHRFDREGTRINSFAVPYRYSARLVAVRMKRGFITCPTPETVLLAYEYQNRIDAYDTFSGDLLWYSTFEGIRLPPLRERIRPDGRLSVGIDVLREQDTYHFLLGVSGGNGVPVIVQFGRRKKEEVLNRIDDFVVETFLVDPISGSGLYIGEELPQVLTAEGDRVALLRIDPFPVIELGELAH